MSFALLERAAVALGPLAERVAFHAFQQSLRARGFRKDIDSGVICRWVHDEPELVLDAMPAAGELLGFENPWQRAAMPFVIKKALPSGRSLRAIPPAYLVATKLSAFSGRGGGDHLGSRDLEDVVTLVDGREELVEEVRDADAAVRGFLSREVGGLLDQPRFIDAVFGVLRGDPANQARVESVVLPRLRAIAS